MTEEQAELTVNVPSTSSEKNTSQASTLTKKAETWNKSIGGLSKKKKSLTGLVKVKNPQNDNTVAAPTDKKSDPISTSHQNNDAESNLKTDSNKTVSNSLSLLGAYSDSDNSD